MTKRYNVGVAWPNIQWQFFSGGEMLRRILAATTCITIVSGCGRAVYEKHLPPSPIRVPPWFSSQPALPNSFGFKNLGTAQSPSVLYLTDNLANDGDILSVALNGRVVLENITITTPDAGPPYSISMALKQGTNQVDILCVHDPGGGCTLQAEISNTTAGQGLTTINDSPIPQGQYASFVIEYKPF